MRDQCETETTVEKYKLFDAQRAPRRASEHSNGQSRLVLRVSLAALVALVLGASCMRAGLARGPGGLPGPRSVLACYYSAVPEPARPQPAALPAHLCSHINVAFARVVNKQVLLDDDQYRALVNIVKLKGINPELKVLVSVGGASDDSGFSEMVADHASRKIFIKSVKNLLRNYTLDGIDLDWEFPAIHESASSKFYKRERQHFSQLLREIKAEFIREKRDYLLTVAVAAPETIVDVSYDVDQLDLYADFVNVMTYDFHYYTKFTPFTGLNSPLFPRPSEQLYMATLNINYTVQMYINKGLSPGKIVVGIPTYGHTFTLVNMDNTGIGSPVSGFGSLGSKGFVDYPDICTYLRNHNKEATVKQDKDAKVPYLYRDHEWVSFDTPQSVMEKAKFIRERGLRGAMIYSLNADDYEGICEGKLGNKSKYPLSQTVKNALLNGVYELPSPNEGIEK